MRKRTKPTASTTREGNVVSIAAELERRMVANAQPSAEPAPSDEGDVMLANAIAFLAAFMSAGVPQSPLGPTMEDLILVRDRPAEAIPRLTLAIEREPLAHALLGWRSLAYARLGKHHAALADFERAHAIAPESKRYERGIEEQKRAIADAAAKGLPRE